MSVHSEVENVSLTAYFPRLFIWVSRVRNLSLPIKLNFFVVVCIHRQSVCVCVFLFAFDSNSGFHYDGLLFAILKSHEWAIISFGRNQGSYVKAPIQPNDGAFGCVWAKPNQKWNQIKVLKVAIQHTTLLDISHIKTKFTDTLDWAH